MTILEEHVEAAMQVSMDIIARGEEINPLVVFFRKGLPNLPLPLKLDCEENNTICRKLVRAFILKFRPDFAVMVTDAYMLTAKTPEGDLEKIRDHYEPGDVARSPHRVETIVVDGAGIGEKYTAMQPYKRKGKKIVFMERVVLPKDGYVDNAFFDNAFEVLEKEGKVVH
jgi:hypothetical protein